MSRHIHQLLASSFLILIACSENTSPDPQQTEAREPRAMAATAAIANTWTTARSTLSPARMLSAAATVNNFIYFIGGDAGVEPDRAMGTHDAYEVATNIWSRRKTLPSGRSQPNGASVIGGKIYVSGGTRPALDGNGYSLSRTLLVYNPQTNSWTRKADMPVVSAGGAQGVISGQLYVYVPSGGFGEFFRYNPTTNSWTRRATPPQLHWQGAAGIINGKFYLIGGTGGGGVCCSFPSQRLDVYDPATNRWSTKASMSEGREEFFAGVINGKLYVAGGLNDVGAVLASTEVYNPATNTWTTRTPLPTRQALGASTVANGKLFAIGGVDVNGVTKRVQVYTP